MLNDKSTIFRAPNAALIHVRRRKTEAGFAVSSKNSFNILSIAPHMDANTLNTPALFAILNRKCERLIAKYCCQSKRNWESFANHTVTDRWFFGPQRDTSRCCAQDQRVFWYASLRPSLRCYQLRFDFRRYRAFWM